MILCGYGRVGQNVGRVLESEGFEFLAMDLDPVRVRAALAAGDAVVYGDASDDGVLRSAGLDRANSVVVTFSDTSRALAIVRAVRRLRRELPILVRAADDTHLEELIAAGATEVVPETLEAALTLVSNALHMLKVPPLARHPGGRRNPRPALQDAALGDPPRPGRARRRVGRVPRGTAHGRAAAGRLVDRTDASARCAGAAPKCRSRPCGATASSAAIRTRR